MRKMTVFYGHFVISILPHLRNFAQLLPFAEKKSGATVVFASVGFETTDFCRLHHFFAKFAHPNGGFENFSIISLNKSAPEAIGAGLGQCISTCTVDL